MIIYNVTIKIDLSIHDEWMDWMINLHIPDVMETGFFVDYKLFRIIEEDESGGISYAIQYSAENIGDYFDYQAKAAPRLQQEHTEKFRDKFVAYRTLMKPVVIPNNKPS